MIHKFFKLENNIPVPCSLMEWVQYMAIANRSIFKTKIDDVEVSTIFLGLDHNYSDGPPLIYETMVFNGPLNGTMKRYSTLGEAKNGHCEMVDKVNQLILERS